MKLLSNGEYGSLLKPMTRVNTLNNIFSQLGQIDGCVRGKLC